MLGLEERRGTDPAKARERAQLSRRGCHAAAARIQTQVIRKPWVARIRGVGPDGMIREFVDHMRDYRDASASGKRGVKLFFILRNGFYEVREVLSMTRDRRYFVEVRAGEIAEVDRAVVDRWALAAREGLAAWLKNSVASASAASGSTS